MSIRLKGVCIFKMRHTRSKKARDTVRHGIDFGAGKNGFGDDWGGRVADGAEKVLKNDDKKSGFERKADEMRILLTGGAFFANIYRILRLLENETLALKRF